jgi:starch synthase (maltosyl-transferring)
LYGIYSGYELCENAALPNKEEYLDSEKYQWKERDWNAPGNLKDLITRLNRIRRENRALQGFRNLRFHRAENEQVLFYSKSTEAGDNLILVVVSLDPWRPQETMLEVPLELLQCTEDETYQVHDLLSGERFLWSGRRNYVALDPHQRPAHVFRVRKKVLRETDFDAYW